MKRAHDELLTNLLGTDEWVPKFCHLTTADRAVTRKKLEVIQLVLRRELEIAHAHNQIHQERNHLMAGSFFR